MFITPQLTSPQFGTFVKKKPQEKQAPITQKAEPSQNNKNKKVTISKLVEKQLKRLAEKFNKDMDLMKLYYQTYASITDENGLRTISDSEAIKRLEEELARPVMRHTMALHENGGYWPR
jgi:hypothetical protein